MSETSHTRRITGLIMRVAVSGALLAWLFTRPRMAEAFGVFGQADPLQLLPAAFFFIALVALSAWRWKALVGGELDFRTVFRLTYIGYFFNNFLPTNFGGDSVRVVHLSNRPGWDWRSALASVFWDRYIGLAGLMVMGGCAFVLRFGEFAKGPLGLMYTAMLGLFTLSALILLWLSSGGHAILPGVIARLLPEKLTLPTPTRLLTALALSLAAQAAGVVCFWFLARSLSVEVSLADALLFLPLANIIAMAPVSISGLGVREGAVVYLFGLSGVASQKALALSLFWFFFTVLMSLWGGVLFLKRGRG